MSHDAGNPADAAEAWAKGIPYPFYEVLLEGTANDRSFNLIVQFKDEESALEFIGNPPVEEVTIFGEDGPPARRVIELVLGEPIMAQGAMLASYDPSEWRAGPIQPDDDD